MEPPVDRFSQHERRIKYADTWLDLIKDIGVVVLVWGAVVFMCFTGYFLTITKDRLSEADKRVHEILNNVRMTSGVANALMGKVYGSYDRTNEVTDATLSTIRQANATLARLDLEVFGPHRQRPSEPKALILLVRLLLEDSDRNLNVLSLEALNTLNRFGGAADALQGAAISVDDTLLVVKREIEKNSSLSQQSLTNLAKALDTLEKQIDGIGKGVTANLKNTEAATGHLNEITASVDEALRPLRAKVGKLKAFLKFVSQFFRLTVPVF